MSVAFSRSGRLAFAAACALGFADALSLEDRVAGSMAAQGADLVEGVLSMVQNGRITIPIEKMDTTYLAQTQTASEATLADEPSLFNLAQVENLDVLTGCEIVSAQSGEMADTEGKLSNIMVREPLTNSQNLSYIGELYMGGGTPQKVRAIFDTGSANPWILGKEGAKGMDQSKEIDPFDPAESITYKEPASAEQTWVRISFGSGYLRGYFVQDQVMMGDPNNTSNQMVVSDWTFGMVVDHTVFNGNFDALIGLAYPQFAEPGVTPLFDALISSKQLDKNVFSFFLSYNPDEQSTLTFGGWDEDKIEGDI